MIKKPEESIVEDSQLTDQAELAVQIAQLPITDLLSLTEFLNPDDEAIVDEDGDIFTSVVEHYSVERPGEEESSDEEEEVEEIDTAAVLQYIEKLKLWKLQKGDCQDIQALDRIEREIVRYKSSTVRQTTIHRFFKPK